MSKQQTIITRVIVQVEEKKSPKKPSPVKLSEEEKIADPLNYIKNPKTGNMVLRKSPLGRTVEMLSQVQTAEVIDEKMNLEYETLNFEHDSLKYSYEQLFQENELLKEQIRAIKQSFDKLEI